METGSPYNLTSWDPATADAIENAKDPVVLNTASANGPKSVAKVVNAQVARLQENIAPYLIRWMTRLTS